MASKRATTRMMLEAETGLIAALTRMADQLGVAVPDLAGIAYRRDPAYGQAIRFQAFAEAATLLADELIVREAEISILVDAKQACVQRIADLQQQVAELIRQAEETDPVDDEPVDQPDEFVQPVADLEPATKPTRTSRRKKKETE